MRLMSNMNIDLISTWYATAWRSWENRTWLTDLPYLCIRTCSRMFMKAFHNDQTEWHGWVSCLLMECILIIVAAVHPSIPLEILCGRVGDPAFSQARTRTHDIKYCTTLDTTTTHAIHRLIAFVNFYSWSFFLFEYFSLYCFDVDGRDCFFLLPLLFSHQAVRLYYFLFVRWRRLLVLLADSAHTKSHISRKPVKMYELKIKLN